MLGSIFCRGSGECLPYNFVSSKTYDALAQALELHDIWCQNSPTVAVDDREVLADHPQSVGV